LLHGKGYINTLLRVQPLNLVLRWPHAMFFTFSTCQASKNNFSSKAKHAFS
jgi:hypothetical protein